MVGSELPAKVGERVEAVGIVETFLVFPVVAIHLVVVAFCLACCWRSGWRIQGRSPSAHIRHSCHCRLSRQPRICRKSAGGYVLCSEQAPRIRSCEYSSMAVSKMIVALHSTNATSFLFVDSVLLLWYNHFGKI